MDCHLVIHKIEHIGHVVRISGYRLSCEMSTRWGQPREGSSVL